jgi:hypothetical protein
MNWRLLFKLSEESLRVKRGKNIKRNKVSNNKQILQ